MTWCTDKTDGVIINLRIVPRAAKNEICGIHDEAIKVRLQAPPVDGKANKALIKFMAKTLGIRQSDIEIISGESSRNKRVHVSGLTAAALMAEVSRQMSDVSEQ